jgi:hypothetical protein
VAVTSFLQNMVNLSKKTRHLELRTGYKIITGKFVSRNYPEPLIQMGYIMKVFHVYKHHSMNMKVSMEVNTSAFLTVVTN